MVSIALALFALTQPTLRATPQIQTEGNVSISVFSGTIIDADFNGNYGTVTVSGTGNEPVSYTLAPFFAGAFFLTGTTTPGMFQLTNDAGGIFNESGAGFLYGDAAGAEFGKIGNGAIRIIAQPAAYNPSKGAGGNIVWNGIPATQIGVQGNGTTTIPAPSDTLLPPGFRMAQLSGIAAISYGDQTVTSGTIRPGGNVTINATGTTMMSNTDPTQITAGVSAASANGTGTTYGDAGPASVTTTLTNGLISNSAQAGIGLMAVATGAQFQPGTSSVAYGGNVTASSTNSVISLTGTTGIGIFAVSEVYVASEPPKNSTVEAGTVSVTIDAVSSISTGTPGALFSMGVLAAGAGTDFLINPFASQTVNGHGEGSGGFVQITNSGTVTTQGTLAIGLAGLSIGGAGIVTTNSGTASESFLGNSGTSTNGQGGDVTIVNSGYVATVGSNGFGLVALSTGGGGIINNEIAAAEASGLVVGNFTSTTSGSASNGGVITGTNAGTIITGDGNNGGVASMGIVAQSIGGGGGNAGGDKAAWFVGDKGGQGGNGGAINLALTNGSSLTTRDENSIGVLAQSIGGGGGNGANAKGLFVAVGGRGGKGGAGGAITIGVDGDVNTEADYSSGLIAQSIGGGGGHGGTATSVGLFIDVGQGGQGGTGGAGGVVAGTVGSSGSISTAGNNATAFHLQSVGGGGGTGGASSAYSGGGSTGEGVSLNFNISVGGTGGSGGLGGTVSGTNAGVITTGVAFSGSNSVPNVDGADSVGMIAQSIGGGGGHGGNALGKSLAVSTGTGSPVSLKFDLALGGSGGSGQHGGTAGLVNQGTVTTWGDGSHGLLAQSVGGGGGSGGDSTAASSLSAEAGVAITLTMAVGGTGAGGGNGNLVTADNSGAAATIQTHGQNAVGILAQSIGGGGGSGGLGNAKLHTPTTGTGSAFSINTQVGAAGAGGGGGQAGAVEVSNDGAITTVGSGAQGVLAQAIGGGGGNAGGGSAAGSNNPLTLNIALGLFGGAGGSATGTNSLGNSVTVTNSGTISTSGGGGTGILAQSIGGGGGTGGSADADAAIGKVGSITNLIFSSTGYTSKVSLGAAIGGTGGEGGAGGSVLIEQGGSLSTQGSQAYGILAQSISGGGGVGGAATAASNPGLFDGYNGTLQFAANVAVGGQGGDGHSGGAVTVNNSGTTSTSGYGAHAVVAQSVAGGGGAGADGTIDANSTLGLGVGVNNHTSGTSANGGTVIVNQTGNIVTSGGDASGVVAQSISGGGGLGSTGGDRKLLSPDFSIGVLPVHLDFTMGINLNSTYAADGGAVTVNTGTAGQSTTMTTTGDLSHGIVAQSLGAGGGKSSAIFGTNSSAYADFSSTITTVTGTTSVTSGRGINLGAVDGHGAGGTVNINLVNNVITTGVSGSTGYGSYGILAQSLGGGGGLATVDTAAANGMVWLGGTSSASGVGGHGGAVNLNGGGTVTTRGEAAHSVVLQSIGGGGGAAIIGSSREFSGTSAPTGLAVDLTLGSRESFGLGNAVYSAASMTIQTFGDNAFGLVAQSIGGGGGLATSQQGGSVSLGMQAAGSDSYNGGAVTIGTDYSTITTSGDGSHGLVAQSIGGGGGIANPSSAGGLTTTPSMVNSGTALGYGGAVDLIVTGTIQTSGAGAFGVIAQSISGGGGLAGSFAGSTGGAHSTGSVGSGTAGNVTVASDVGSLISTTGTGATAIFAQNDTADSLGAGSVSLSLQGTVTGGSGSNAYGIWVDGGNSGNSITVLNTGVVQAASLQAINYTGSHRVNVTNYGTVYGAVSLSDTSGSKGTFTNDLVAGFYAEGTINATVNDSGSLFIGVDSSIGATATFTGTYTQFDTGTIVMDVFSLNNYDQMQFSDGGVGVFGDEIAIQFADTYVPQINDTFLLIGASSGPDPNTLYSSWFTNTNNGNVGVSGLWDGVEWVTTGGAGGSYSITITGIPEPGTAMLVLLGAGGLFIRRKHRDRTE